jgi:hypothetical protein
MIKDIYRDPLLKYPLTDNEIANIDKVWEFIYNFKLSYPSISTYRKNIIKTVKNKYTPEEFNIYETAAEKMFWNLRFIISPLWLDSKINEHTYEEEYTKLQTIPKSLLLYNSYNYEGKKDLYNKVSLCKQKKAYYRSYINKMCIVRENTLIYKQIEGSSDIFSKNYFNLYSTTIFMNKQLYESIIKNPFIIKNKKINLPEFYFQFDYAFPNFNYCVLSTNKNKKLKRINKMYYSNKAEKNWFKFII